MRVGPISSPPGAWHYFDAAWLKYKLLHPGDQIIAHVGRPVTGDDVEDDRVSPGVSPGVGGLLGVGLPIGYPPLHIHHIHVGKVSKDFTEDDFHYWQTHGDFGQGPSFGLGARSTAGYTRRVPAGFAVHVDTRDQSTDMYLLAVINDVRGKDDGTAGGAVLGPWYLEVAFALAPRTEQRIAASLLWFDPPHSRLHPRDVYRRYSVSNTRHSLSWWMSTMPCEGVLLEDMWLHTHRARYRDVLVVAALPAQLGLDNCSRWDAISPIDDEHAGTPDPDAVVASLRSSGRVVCRRDPAVPTQMVLAPESISRGLAADAAAEERGGSGTGGPAGILPGHYDRAGKLRCEPWRFGAGDAVTIVAFHEVVWDEDVAVYPMHTNVFFFAQVPPPPAARGEGVPAAHAESSAAESSPWFSIDQMIAAEGGFNRGCHPPHP